MAWQLIKRTPEFDREIFTVYGETFGEENGRRFEARWPWQYLENPANDEEDPINWIIVEDGRLLGHISTMPFWMWWGDREVRARSSLDQFVRPEARGRGLGVALVKAHIKDIELGLALGMTASSFPIFQKIFTDIGPVPAYLKPLDAMAIARRRWGPVVGSVAGPVIGLGLTVFSRRFAPAAGLEVREASGFTEDYTGLWTRARASFASVVRRDRVYLDWKYGRCPYHRYRVLEARTRGALTGFVVIRDEGDEAFRRGLVVDLFCDTGDLATQDALIDAAAGDFRSRGLVRAETYVLHQSLGAAFRRHGFRPGRTQTNYCIAACRSSAEPLARRWEHQLMLGDGDLDRG